MVEIVPYDPSWPALFLEEARNIRQKFGELALRVDHVGSTSVPALPAKPVIDIQVSVASLEPREALNERMTDLGYTHFDLGAFDRVYPFFKKPSTWPSTHHVHLCLAGSEQERMHLAFRDYLREHPAVSADYFKLKQQLAAVYDGTTLESQEGYSLAKSDFVSSVLDRAFSKGYPLRAPSDA
jgi:GrpB-like predicted nucleotidyltransferase (UPF0157 family)